MSRFQVLFTCASVLLMLGPHPLHAAEGIGTLARLRGDAVAIADSGARRELEQGAALYAGDDVETSRRSSAFIELADGTRFVLGPEARLELDQLVFGRSESEDSLLARVSRGAFRFVSGLIAKRKPAAMSVRLGVVATVGVRGTTVEGEVVGESATVVLETPEDGQPKTAIEVYNDFGSVIIDEPGFGTRVPDARSAPTPPERMKLRAIENVMRSLQSVGRAARPRPMP